MRFWALLAIATSLFLIFRGVSGKSMNVLFILSDDMRPDIGAFQAPTDLPRMRTPNLDSLAARGLLLRHAYVQQAVCSPSRTSMLTGRRPDTTHVHDLLQYWRTVGGNFTTLPQYFKENGYRTAGLGKVFHPGMPSGYNDPMSWTEKYFNPNATFWDAKTQRRSWLAADDDDVRANPLPDMQTADEAVETMRNLSAGGKPFFLAVGFHKPHLPFVFPKRFLDYYPLASIPLPDNPYAPSDMPEVAWSNFDELRKYSDVWTTYGYGAINTTLPDALIINLRRAYYASISYVDEMVGKLLDNLTRLGLANSTIVSFVGDHGWQLGEHGEWCKHTNFELATRAPLIVSVPRLTEGGRLTDALVELVDLFPTIIEAAGLPAPPLCPKKSAKIPLCTEGFSFVPLLTDPQRPWKNASFSQYPRMLVDGDVVMGYSMRTAEFRYTEWPYYDTVNFRPFARESLGIPGRKLIELYDHVRDPQENVNLVYSGEYSRVRKILHKALKAGWRAAMPPPSPTLQPERPTTAAVPPSRRRVAMQMRRGRYGRDA